jgi:hypothetical protein
MEDRLAQLSVAVDCAIGTVIEKLNKQDLKLNISELIKLLELQKELQKELHREEVRCVTATWIDSEEDSIPFIDE